MTRYSATLEFPHDDKAATLTLSEEGGDWSASWEVVGTTGTRADIYAEAKSLAAATATSRGGYLGKLTVVRGERPSTL